MGGNAFSSELGEDAFPRIPPVTYEKLKTDLGGQLKELYEHVGTPTEAPEKTDHGDVDFIVDGPKRDISHDETKKALGATYVISAEGNRTSNYAVPIPGLEGRYYQVDVNVCADKEEWDNIMFFHSYGDMGMILGVLMRAHGLSLGTKGLKIHSSQSHDIQPATLSLSSSFPDILRFMGLQMDTWAQGFKSMDEIFSWVQTSRFFIPSRMTTTPKEMVKRKTRSMYQSFFAHSHALAEVGALSDRPTLEPAAVVQEALLFFGKKEEYDAIVKKKEIRIALNTKFTGKHIMKWTGLYGFAVRDVMRGVRERMGEEGILSASEEEIEVVTREVQQELGLRPINIDNDSVHSHV